MRVKGLFLSCLAFGAFPFVDVAFLDKDASAGGRAKGLIFTDKEELSSFRTAPKYRDYLPSSVDLSRHFPQPQDQGQQGSCTAWATGYGLRGYYEIKSGVPEKDLQFSPSYIYNQIAEVTPDCSNGTAIPHALNLLMDQGVAPMKEFPYDEKKCFDKPNQSHRDLAGDFRIDSWVTIDVERLDDVKGQLSAGHPVVFGMKVNEKFDNLKWGEVYRDSGTDGGGHAMVVAGYDDRKNAFRIFNSWGFNWAEGGYAWVDYETFQKRTNAAYAVRMPDVNAIPEMEPEVAPDPDPFNPDDSIQVVMVDPVIVEPEPVIPDIQAVDVITPEPEPAPTPVVTPVIAPENDPEITPDVTPVIEPEPVQVVVTPDPAPEPVVSEPEVVEPVVEPIVEPVVTPVVEPEITPEPVVPTPDPEPTPVNQQVNVAALERYLSQMRCSSFDVATSDDGKVSVKGFLGDKANLDGLVGLAQPYLDSKALALDIDVRPWPQCEALKTFAGAFETPQGLSAKLIENTKQDELTEGEALVLSVNTPDFPGYVYITYLQSGGEAVHLSRPNYLASPHEANSVYEYGNDPTQPIFLVGPPYGPEMIIVLVTERPLFDRHIDIVEEERTYLSTFRSALLYNKTETEYGKTAAYAVYLDTKPKN